MFKLFVLLVYLAFVDPTDIFIDVSAHGIRTYFESLDEYFRQEIIEWKPGKMTHSTCFCSVSLSPNNITSYDFKKFGAKIGTNDDNYLEISDVNITITGKYLRKFLFLSFSNSYSARISSSSIVLGPIIPFKAGGIPMVYNNLTCAVRDLKVVDVDTEGWLVKGLITDAIKNSIEVNLCHHLNEILDKNVRSQGLQRLEVRFAMHHDPNIIASYHLSDYPQVLHSNSFRFPIDSEIGTTNIQPVRFEPPDAFMNTTLKRHVAYHIHESMLTKLTQNLCELGYLDGNFTSYPSNQSVKLICTSTRIRIKKSSKVPVLNLDIQSIETYSDTQNTQSLRSFMVSILYNSFFELLFRLKSQIAFDKVDNSYNDQLFTHIYTRLADNFVLPMPFVHNLTISDTIFKSFDSYFTIMANFEPPHDTRI